VPDKADCLLCSRLPDSCRALASGRRVQRDVQDIDGAVCDALYAKLLAEGRVKAKPRKKAATQAVHIRRLTPDGKLLPCLPHRDSTLRCYRRHAENDPVIGQPIEAREPSRHAAGKTVEASRNKLPPGVVVDGKVIESDGKTENAQHVLALDPFTLAALQVHVEMLDQERREFGPDYRDHGVLFCWENGKPPHPRHDQPADSSDWRRPGCQRSTCTTYDTATRRLAGMRRSTGRRSASASATRMLSSP
jgi:hypothetical protein